MKYVIDIPEDVKKAFDEATKDGLYGCYYDANSVVGKAIKNGTQLPNGHGRLIDADELGATCDWCHTDDDGSWCYKCKDIDNAPTIIEADKEGAKE